MVQVAAASTAVTSASAPAVLPECLAEMLHLSTPTRQYLSTLNLSNGPGVSMRNSSFDIIGAAQQQGSGGVQGVRREHQSRRSGVSFSLGRALT